jgi:hypothetical protein
VPKGRNNFVRKFLRAKRLAARLRPERVSAYPTLTGVSKRNGGAPGRWGRGAGWLPADLAVDCQNDRATDYAQGCDTVDVGDPAGAGGVRPPVGRRAALAARLRPAHRCGHG